MDKLIYYMCYLADVGVFCSVIRLHGEQVTLNHVCLID